MYKARKSPTHEFFSITYAKLDEQIIYPNKALKEDILSAVGAAAMPTLRTIVHNAIAVPKMMTAVFILRSEIRNYKLG